ncbi:MAG: hypothetical protein EP343_34000 [Deltaproteobacteria bacterium]|nr:MAG: hypothetical protein EP343_34000 [Deltaproteobacteria bacterium]
MTETKPSQGNPENKSYQRQLKNLLLDRPFQLRYTLFTVLITVLMCVVVGGVMMWQARRARTIFDQQRKAATESLYTQREATTRLVSETRKRSIQDLEKVLKTAMQTLNVQLQDKDPMVRKMALQLREELRRDNDARVVRQRDEEKRIKNQREKADREFLMLRRNQDVENAMRAYAEELLVLAVLGGVCLIVILLVSFFAILFTHRVVGPLYKMERYLKQLGDGEDFEVAPLRRKDQLRHFYDIFKETVASVRQRNQDTQDALKQLVQLAEKEKWKGDAVEQAKALLHMNEENGEAEKSDS